MLKKNIGYKFIVIVISGIPPGGFISLDKEKSRLFIDVLFVHSP